VTPGDNNPNLG